MNYRTHRGFRVSEIGIGCYALSGVYGHKDQDEFQQMVRRAVELEVNFFDTAGSYGEEAEELLGKSLAPFRKNVLISTKVGVVEGTKFDLTSRSIRTFLERSLKRLKTDWIDILQVHFDDPDTPVQDTVATLEALKNEGKILQYGVGHLPPERVLEYLEIGKPFSLMFELSAVSRSARQRFFPLLEKYEIKGIAFSVTGRGMLAFKSVPESFPPGDLRNYDPLFQRDLRASGMRVRQKLDELARNLGKTLAQVAIAWVLSHPQIICALCGPSTIPHLEENVKASGWQIPPEELRKLEALLEEEDKRLARERLETTTQILSASSSGETESTTLIYALDTLIELGFIKEKEGLPLYLRIMRLDGMPLNEKRGTSQSIKDELLSYLNPV
ncbi:MAG: aldo/keto reductase [Coprothermobacterota bacterium]|nr:aldo/keto reductase [Coprothermobacterota bacterium]